MTLLTPTLHTDRLVLRPVRDTDTDDLFALHSDAHVLRYWDSPAWTDPARAERFVADSRRIAAAGTGVRPIVEDAHGTFLGWCVLSDWNPAFRSASLGYCLTQASWGRGYATEAAGALLLWAYEALDLNRVQSEVDTRNLASARVLTKLGFTQEGTLREECVDDGVVSDTWIYGLLRGELTVPPAATANGPSTSPSTSTSSTSKARSPRSPSSGTSVVTMPVATSRPTR